MSKESRSKKWKYQAPAERSAPAEAAEPVMPETAEPETPEAASAAPAAEEKAPAERPAPAEAAEPEMPEAAPAKEETASGAEAPSDQAAQAAAGDETGGDKRFSPWELVKTVFTAAVVLVAVAMMVFTIVSVSTFDRNDRALFGYKAFIVRSDSMSATDFSAGDLVLVKDVDPTTLQPGDIIAFRSNDPDSFGETFTHKIRSHTTDENGRPAFITYGTTTNVDDAVPVPYENVQGQYQFAMKGVGTFFSFLKTVPGYVCCILIPFMLLIVMQGLNSVKLFRQYKEEQMAEIDAKRKRELDEMAAEREKLAAERLESQRMLEQLKQLQEQMAASGKETL